MNLFRVLPDVMFSILVVTALTLTNYWQSDHLHGQVRACIRYFLEVPPVGRTPQESVNLDLVRGSSGVAWGSTGCLWRFTQVEARYRWLVEQN